MKGRRLQAWETVRNLLMRDSDLRRLGVLWILPESSDFDNPPPTDKISIRLEPKLGEVSRMASCGNGICLYEQQLTISLEVEAPGGLNELWENMPRIADVIQTLVDERNPAWQVGGCDDIEMSVPPDWGQPGMISVMVYEER